MRLHPVCRCTSKRWASDQLILTFTSYNASDAPSLGRFHAYRCSKTAFIEIVFFIWSTLIAQIVLNLRCEINPPLTMRRASPSLLTSRRDYRMYAITRGNLIVTGFFAFITAVQFGVGVYLIVLAANSPGMVSASMGHCVLGSGYRCLWPLVVVNSVLRPPPIHLSAFQVCAVGEHRIEEIAHIAILLFYGSPFPRYCSILAR